MNAPLVVFNVPDDGSSMMAVNWATNAVDAYRSNLLRRRLKISQRGSDAVGAAVVNFDWK